MKTNVSAKIELSPKQRDDLLTALKARFDANKARHQGLVWAKVQARLEARPDKLWSLAEMERTGGEPDVVGQDKKSGEVIFFDCSEQTPSGRVRLCYDDEVRANPTPGQPNCRILRIDRYSGARYSPRPCQQGFYATYDLDSGGKQVRRAHARRRLVQRARLQH